MNWTVDVDIYLSMFLLEQPILVKNFYDISLFCLSVIRETKELDNGPRYPSGHVAIRATHSRENIL